MSLSISQSIPTLLLWSFMMMMMLLIRDFTLKFRKATFNKILSSVHSCPTLCNPVDCITPGFPVHHQLLKFAQIHVHWVSDAILLPSIFPSIRVFSNGSVLWIRWPEYWSFSFSISTCNEYSGPGWMSLQSKGLSRVFSNTTIQKHQCFSAQISLYPTLTSIPDYWKNHSFD